MIHTIQFQQERKHYVKQLVTLNDRYGLDFDPAEEIITTVGATEGLYIIGSNLNPDDKVLIPTPAYPVYAEMTRINGGHQCLLTFRRRIRINARSFTRNHCYRRPYQSNHYHQILLIQLA